MFIVDHTSYTSYKWNVVEEMQSENNTENVNPVKLSGLCIYQLKWEIISNWEYSAVEYHTLAERCLDRNF